MFDLTRSVFNDLREKPVAPSATIAEEGVLLVYVDNGGEAAVQPCAAGAGQAIAGWAITDAMKRLTEVVQETVTVPSAGGTVNLSNANIVASSVRAVASTTGALAEDLVSAGAGEFFMNNTNGTIAFNVAEADQTVVVTYRYTLTLQESLSRHHERSVNNRAQDYFSTVSVGMDTGEIHTSMYVTSVAYAVGDSVYPAASGFISSAAGGASNPVGVVVKVPSAGNALLGVKYDLPLKS